MFSGLKLLVPCALALYFAAACTPDLDSLSANYSPSTGASGGTDNSEGGMDAAGGGGPVVTACSNHKKDSNESDVDCGGTSKCDRCAAKAHCTADRDCDDTLFCSDNACTEPSCSDNIQNEDETGVDCGGPCAKKCDLGVACSSNVGCSSLYCSGGVCADHCVSGAKELDETDKDCGGSCAACGDGRHCVEGSDCVSKVCSNNLCQAATCSDQVKNQNESDKDCGGECSATKPCPVSAYCNSAADCDTWICGKNGKCSADIVVEPSAIIDDFEDGDFLLPANPALQGRVGNWYAYGDGTGVGTEDIALINRGPSTNGLHAKGKDFTSWGSGVGVDVNNSGAGQATKSPYDASAYSGVTFWARAEAALTVTVVLPDADTDAAGQTCTTAGPPVGICDHHYFKSVQVTTIWQRFSVAFADLTLEPGGVPAPTAFKPGPDAAPPPAGVPPRGIVSVQFRVASGQDYDLYIDDVAFVK
ncbi:MAG: hypothetical protein WDO69_30195 [Pseudomonadota bacterium]